MGDTVIDRGVFTAGGSQRLWAAALPAQVRIAVDGQGLDEQEASLVLVDAMTLRLQIPGESTERAVGVEDVTLLELL